MEFGLENPEFYEIMYLHRPHSMERFPRELFRRATRSMDVLTRLVREAAPGAFAGPEEARIHAHAVWAILHGVVSTIIAARLDTRIDQAAYIDTSIQFAVDAIRRMEPAGVPS